MKAEPESGVSLELKGFAVAVWGQGWDFVFSWIRGSASGI